MQYQLNLPAPYERGTTLSGGERKVLSSSIERTNAAVLDAVREMGGATAFEVHDRVGGCLLPFADHLPTCLTPGCW